MTRRRFIGGVFTAIAVMVLAAGFGSSASAKSNLAIPTLRVPPDLKSPSSLARPTAPDCLICTLAGHAIEDDPGGVCRDHGGLDFTLVVETTYDPQLGYVELVEHHCNDGAIINGHQHYGTEMARPMVPLIPVSYTTPNPAPSDGGGGGDPYADVDPNIRSYCDGLIGAVEPECYKNPRGWGYPD
jgi:hypothetical protein